VLIGILQLNENGSGSLLRPRVASHPLPFLLPVSIHLLSQVQLLPGSSQKIQMVSIVGRGLEVLRQHVSAIGLARLHLGLLQRSLEVLWLRQRNQIKTTREGKLLKLFLLLHSQQIQHPRSLFRTRRLPLAQTVSRGGHPRYLPLVSVRQRNPRHQLTHHLCGKHGQMYRRPLRMKIIN